ncbi:hypothetical protein MN116_000985 [Schistosoma mekongi]|uniref:Uncharacterized protein n=1 Tax=Schistosoma mekongi TaxID=38744 RepID=A0AAE2D8Y4_SCHME|nr:hypothetical protein MN116_000985 [Schistosoma mekongi]
MDCIKYFIPEIFTQFACNEVIELTLESTLINISSSSSSSSATSSKTLEQRLLETPNSLNYFIGLPNLIRLRLINNPYITCYASEIFNGISTHLQELYLIGNPVKEIKIKDFNKFTTNENRLITLDLSFNHLTKIEPNSFVGLLNTSRMYYLRKLNLAHNHITYIHANMFSGLAYLEELNLEDNPITFIEIESFKHLISLRKLVIINTMKSEHNNTISTDKFIRTMFKQLKDLQELNLIGLQMYNIQSNLFNDLHQLRKLNLAYNQFIKVPIIYQYDNSNSSNMLTYSSLLPLTIMIRTKLVYFNLSYNQITCLTTNSFIHLNKLKHLILHDNLINIITRNAFHGLLSLEILELQRNPLQLIQPLAFIPIKISLQQILLNNVIKEQDEYIIEYLNHTSLALLSQATKIIGLEKWDIYKGGNHNVDYYFNNDYIQLIDEDIDCNEDIKSIYRNYWKLIKFQDVLEINDKNENEQFTLINHIDKNNEENQNVIIILFSTGMILIILLSGILIPYRHYAYNTKWKQKIRLSKTNSLKYSLSCRHDHEEYLQNNGNQSKCIECNHFNHSHQSININNSNDNYLKLMKRSSINMNNKTTRLNSLLSRTNLFGKRTQGGIVPITTSIITTTNNSNGLQNYNWFWLNPLQINDITISNNNIPLLNGDYLMHIQQNRDIQRQIYDELQMVNSGGSPQTTYLSDTSYYDNNLIKAQKSNTFRSIHMDTTTANTGSNHGSILKSEYIYPLTILIKH